jgi:hypothetical protein
MRRQVNRIVHHDGPVRGRDGGQYVARIVPGAVIIDLTAPPAEIADAMYLAGYRAARRELTAAPVISVNENEGLG